jgi:transcriptional regulator with XRE-family HTH domain
MKRLKDLRKGIGYTQAGLADALGVSQQTIARWEKGDAEPSLSMLRDLATIMGTSVDDLVEFDSGAGRIPSQHWMPADPVVVDGFWGHIGLLLPGEEEHRWYPITRGEADRVSSNLYGATDPAAWLVIATLNNRVLLVNPSAIQRIRLLDDAADQPDDDNWNLTWDGYQGLAPEIYRAIGDYFWDEAAFEADYSEALRQMARDHIEQHEIDDEGAARFLEYTHTYLNSGIEVSLRAESDELFSLTLEADCLIPDRVVLINEYSAELNFFPAHSVALVSMPLTQYQKAARESLMALEGEGK